MPTQIQVNAGATRPREDSADSQQIAGQFVNACWIRTNNPPLIAHLLTKALGGDKAAITDLTTLAPNVKPTLSVGTPLSGGWITVSQLPLYAYTSISPTHVDFGSAQKPGQVLYAFVTLIPALDGQVSATVDNTLFKVENFGVDTGHYNYNITIDQWGVVHNNGGEIYENIPGSGSAFVKANQTVVIEVSFRADDTAIPGSFDATLTIKVDHSTSLVGLHASLSPGQLSLSVSPKTLLVLAGQSAAVQATLTNNGPATQAMVTTTPLPQGVSVSGTGALHLGPNSIATSNLTLSASSNVAEVHGLNVGVDVSGSTSQNHAVQYFRLDVYEPMYEWTQHIEGKYVQVDYTLTISSNGDWIWSGHLHDSSTWYGDFYSLTVGLPYKDPSSGKETLHYLNTSGKLGAEESGPAVNYDFIYTGNSVNLKNNFVFAVQHGPSGHLHTSGDPLGFIEEAFQDAVSIAKKYGPDIAAVAGL